MQNLEEQVANLLDNTADLIEHGRWCQNALVGDRYVDEHGKFKSEFCLVGFVIEARKEKGYADAYDLALDQLLDLSGDKSLPRWNDYPSRTKQEVLDLVRLGAKEARIKSESEEVS